MKRRMFFSIVLLALLASLFWLTTIWAQTPTHRMEMWVVNSSGESRSNSYALNSIAGQPQVGVQAVGATFRVEGGFWPNAAPAPHLYLPIVANDPTPTPQQPQPMVWQRVGPGGFQISALALQGNRLFAADFRGIGQGGGLYHRALANCNLTEGWTRIDTINLSVLDVEFRGTLGLAAAFDETNGIFYSRDSGNTWTRTGNLAGKARTVAIAPDDSAFFVGTENSGVYKSVDGGVNWSLQSATPQFITTIALSTNTIWIGADHNPTTGDTTNAGVWKLGTIGGAPIQVVDGLATGDSRRVWDFLIRSGSEIYIATYNGVFRGDGISTWTPFELQGTQVRSLEAFQGALYAGERIPAENAIAGLWRRPFAGGNWERVPAGNWNKSVAIRDLLVDTAHCNGLLAATEDGVWLYR